MIIKHIEIENFRCYEKQEFHFSKGANIILGQNNSGKSKLFDAFHWVLFNEIYSTEKRKWFATKDIFEEIPCKRSLKKIKGSNLKTRVLLKIDMDNDSGNNYQKLEFERSLISKKVDNKWETSRSFALRVSTIDKDTSDFKDLYDKEAQGKISEFFPEKLKHYFFFQGEGINKLMSMHSRSDFAKALESLSKVEIFKKMQISSKKVKVGYHDDYVSKQSHDKETQKKKEDLSSDIAGYDEDIEKVKSNLKNEQNELVIVSKLKEELEDRVLKYNDVRDVLVEQKEAQIQIKRKNEELEDYKANNVETLINDWIYAGTQDLFDSFINIYTEEKEKGRYPEPVTQEYINEMLTGELCLICNREAPKKSDAYNHIRSHIERASKMEELTDYISLVNEASHTLPIINSLKDAFKNYYENIEEIENDIQTARNILASSHERLLSILPKGVDKDHLKSLNFDQMMSDLVNTQKEESAVKIKIGRFEGNLERLEDLVKKAEIELEEISQSTENEIETARYNIATAVAEHCEDLYTQFNNQLLESIESTTNAYFQDMTKGASARPGTVKIDYLNQQIFTVGEDGEKMLSMNEGNVVSMQIAFIAGILSVSNDYWNDNFPFIADAPTSKLGGDNKATAVNTMLDIFNQSIIILKDDVPRTDDEALRIDPIRQLIRDNNKIKYGYEVYIDKDDVTLQHTQVKTLKDNL